MVVFFHLAYEKDGLNLIFGGGANQYLGGHYGEVVWAEFSSDSDIRDRYYDNDASKLEAHSYLKGMYRHRWIINLWRPPVSDILTIHFWVLTM